MKVTSTETEEQIYSVFEDLRCIMHVHVIVTHKTDYLWILVYKTTSLN